MSKFCTFLATLKHSKATALNVSVMKPHLQAPMLKQGIALVLERFNASVPGTINRCRTLSCRCIATRDDIIWYSSLHKNIKTDPKDTIKENDVSNACLVILRFLILDGKETIKDNLAAMRRESFRYLHKRLSIDDVMLGVMYPLYQVMFESKYKKIKQQFQFDDKFKYNQIIDLSEQFGSLPWDDNEICYQDQHCHMSLNMLADTWQSVINVMDFPWDIGLGSLVANFHFLLDDCAGTRYCGYQTCDYCPSDRPDIYSKYK